MKLKVITRLLIGTSLAVVALVPTLTLTSCASISQWTLPIAIGGSGSKSPWADLPSTELAKKDLQPNFLKSNDYQYNSPNATFSNYLPDSFISYTDRSSGTNNYEFASSYDDSNWNKDDFSPLYHDPKWIDYSDTNVQKMSESFDLGSGDNKKTLSALTSIQNANLYNALSFNSIALGINLFTSGFLHLMTQTGVMNNHKADWYDALFGDINNKNAGFFNHANPEDNKKLYEFLFDLLDVLGEGKFAGKFGQSAIDYKFSSYAYGPGPYISWENEEYSDAPANKLKQFIGWNSSTTQFSFDESQIQKDGNTDQTVLDASNNTLSDSFIYNGDATNDPIPSARAAYTAFSTTGTDKTDLTKNVYYPSVVPVQIPFVITPGDFTYSYYNPLSKHSFQQNDYLLDDIEPVQNQIAKTNVWNNFSSHVDTTAPDYNDKHNWAESLSFTLHNNPNSEQTGVFYKVPGSNASEFLNALNDGRQSTDTANYIDPTTYKILNNDNSILTKNLQSNSYIGFANYIFASFPKEKDSDIVYESMPIFAGVAQNSSGIPAIFPISMLYKDDPQLNNDLPVHDSTKIDTSLWNAKLMPEAYALTQYTKDGVQIWNNSDFKDKAENKIFYLDLEKLFEKQSKIYNFFTSNIDANKKPIDCYNDNNEIFQTIWDLLGKWTNSSGNTWTMVSTNSSDLIQRV